MIKGNKPAGYILDKNDHVVAETRQCSHCQYTWLYKAGSGNRYGMCMFCGGLLCKKCVWIKWKTTHDGCVPFYDVAMNPSWEKDYTFDPKSNIFIKK